MNIEEMNSIMKSLVKYKSELPYCKNMIYWNDVVEVLRQHLDGVRKSQQECVS